MRKRYSLLLLAIIAVWVMTPSSSATKKKVLINSSHDERIADPVGDMKGSVCFDIFTDACEITESNDEITYRNIQDYDMLLLCQPRESFNSDEIATIARFVNNGGGILFLAGHNFYSSDIDLVYINSISEFFGIEFKYSSEFWVTRTIEISKQDHPLLQGIKKINPGRYGYLTVGEPSRGLFYLKQKCIAAYCEYGKGRIVFLANNEFILYPYVDVADNKQFITNVFNWLTEPGGPYLHREEPLNKGGALMNKGLEQMEAGDFALARSTFMQSLSYLKNALEIYESTVTMNQVERLGSLIADAENGITAEALFQEGEALYESGLFSSSILKFEEAQALFQSINSRRSEDCTLYIQKCREMMESKPSESKPSESKPSESKPSESKPSESEEHSSILIGTILGAAVLIIVSGVVIIRRKKAKPKDIDKLELEKKNLNEMFAKKLISEKEYDIVKEEIEGRLEKLREKEKP
jgi:tetratricopeptide (TPR) repeat protein